MAVSKNNFIFGVLAVISILLLAVALTAPLDNSIKVVMVVIAMVVDVIAFSSRFYLYAFGPFLKRHHGVMTIRDDVPFTLAPSGNAIVINNGNTVSATAYVRLPIYNSSTAMSDDEKMSFSKKFGRLISTIKTPVRFTTQLYTINKDDYINRIKDKLSEAEENYAKINSEGNGEPGAIERAKGSLTMWHNLLDNIINVQSNSLVNFTTVTAVGSSEEEAINFVLQQAEEVAAAATSIFGVNAHIASGQEILLFIEPDSIIPTSTVTEQIRQNTIAEAV